MTLLLDLNKWCHDYVSDAAAANGLNDRNPAGKSRFHSTKPSFGIFNRILSRKAIETDPSNLAMVDIIRKNAELPSSGRGSHRNEVPVGIGEFVSEKSAVTFHDLLGGRANPNGSGLLGGGEDAQGAGHAQRAYQQIAPQPQDIEQQQYNDFIATEKSNFNYYLENSNLSPRVKIDCITCMAAIFEYMKKHQINTFCLTGNSEEDWRNGQDICRWVYRNHAVSWMSKNQEKFLLNAFNHYRTSKGLATWSASGRWYE